MAELDARQPEFAKPVSDYIRGVVSEARIAEGRARRGSVAQFGSIEQAYGVPRDILIAVWAMESDFGALQGNFDVVRSLATLAAAGRRRPWAEGELIAALRILAAGDVPRSRLRGSWAGAMGQTQLVPSTYLADAVDADGDGRRDIWGSPADALAAAADLLAKGGWRRDEGWAREVILPAGFDYGLSEGPKEPPSWWQAKGVRRADGQAWTRAECGRAGEPDAAGSGPPGRPSCSCPTTSPSAPTTTPSPTPWGSGMLADRFAGGAPLPHALAARDAAFAHRPAGRAERPGQARLQPRHARRRGGGGDPRGALRAWQKSAGLPADGYLSPDMVQRLRRRARPAIPGSVRDRSRQWARGSKAAPPTPRPCCGAERRMLSGRRLVAGGWLVPQGLQSSLLTKPDLDPRPRPA